MKIFLIDDEVKATEMLRLEIESIHPHQHQIYIFNDTEEAIKKLTLKPDIVFLDINMPKKNGFEFLASITEREFQVIFATAYSEYAIKAIKENACDYILKPFDTSEIETALTKAIRNIRERQTFDIKNLVHNLQDSKLKKVQIPSSEGITFVEISEIIYCRSESNYVHIVTTTETIFIAKTLKYINEILPEDTFIRVHNSILVNRNHIRKYLKADGGMLQMSNGDHVKISVPKRTLLDL